MSLQKVTGGIEWFVVHTKSEEGEYVVLMEKLLVTEIVEEEEVRLERRILERSWQSQQPAIDDILELGFGPAFNINQAHFAKVPRKLTCVDGRTVCGRKIAIPGAGVMMSDQGRSETAKLIRRAGTVISGVHPHFGCGAEAAVRKQLYLQGMSPTEIDGEIQRRYEDMAQHLGVNVGPPAEMRDMRFHNERSLILSGVDHFDPFGLSHIAPFLVNAQFMPSIEDALDAVPFCIDIAIGNNGYGAQRFVEAARNNSNQGKFLVIILGSPFKRQYCSEELKKKLLPRIQAKNFEHISHIVEYEVPKELLK